MMEKLSPVPQLALGAGLMATPAWVQWAQNVSIIAGAVAAVCGAIVGIHAVWRLWRRRHA